MARTIAKALLLGSVLALTGCGTIGNVLGRDKIYGGTVADANSVVEGYKEVVHTNEGPRLNAPELSVMCVCSCVDLPLSIAADTLTLPVTVPISLWHWWKDPKPKEKTTAETPPAVAGPAVLPAQPTAAVSPPAAGSAKAVSGP
jgi:uncharacterized protein YceK